PVSHRPHLTRTSVTTRATNATKSRPAAVACEYSQSRRKASQLSGVIVQLCVAWFTGYVKIAKTTSEAATPTNAMRAPLNTRGSLRLVRASINVATVAPTTTNPSHAQPVYNCWTIKYCSRERLILFGSSNACARAADIASAVRTRVVDRRAVIPDAFFVNNFSSCEASSERASRNLATCLNCIECDGRWNARPSRRPRPARPPPPPDTRPLRQDRPPAPLSPGSRDEGHRAGPGRLADFGYADRPTESARSRSAMLLARNPSTGIT